MAKKKAVEKVTKKDIVKELSDQYGLTQVVTKKIVQGTFDKIIEAIVEHGRIELRNFGVFEVKIRKPREARNPKTGDKVNVPAKTVVVFKAGKLLEKEVAKLDE